MLVVYQLVAVEPSWARVEPELATELVLPAIASRVPLNDGLLPAGTCASTTVNTEDINVTTTRQAATARTRNTSLLRPILTSLPLRGGAAGPLRMSLTDGCLG